MMKCYFIFGNIDLFSVFIPGVVIKVFVFCIIIVAIIIFYSQQIKRLKQQVKESEADKNKVLILYRNTEQANLDLFKKQILEKEKNEMLIAQMSCEINSYVSVIIRMVKLLKGTNLSPEQLKLKDIILSKSKILLESTDVSFNKKNQQDISTKEINKNIEKMDLKNDMMNNEMAVKYPMNILVAEDDAINQKLAIRLLARLGYTADIACNGNEAVKMAGEKKYDMILMDVLMPEMDGFEATRMIKTCLDIHPTIIAVTASPMSGDKEKCLEAGMDDYICKPINIDELFQLFLKWNREKDLVNN